MVDWGSALQPVGPPPASQDENGEEVTPVPEADALPAGGPPGQSGFVGNPQIELRVSKAGRFFVFVDQIGLSPGEEYPEVGACVVPDPAAFDDGEVTADELLLHETAQSADSIVFACELAPAETPYCLMPYLLDPAGAMAAQLAAMRMPGATRERNICPASVCPAI